MHRMHQHKPALTDEERIDREERSREFREKRELEDISSRIIVDVLVEDSKSEKGKVRVKFLGLPGGCGPELTVDRGLALTLQERLEEYLAKAIPEPKQT